MRKFGFITQFFKLAVFIYAVCTGICSALAGITQLAPPDSSSKFTNFVIFDGDSLVTGYPSPDSGGPMGRNLRFPNGTDFPSYVMWDLDTSWAGVNVARGSRELASTAGDKHGGMLTQLEDFNKFVAPRIQQARELGASRIIVVNGGEPGNLLYFCALNSGKGGREAREAAYQALKAYAEKVHGAGALFVDITMPARALTLSKGDRNLEADINAVNERIREHCKTDYICDAIVDLALDPRMQDPGNREYYSDGDHFNAAGYRIWAAYVERTLKQLAAP